MTFAPEIGLSADQIASFPATASADNLLVTTDQMPPASALARVAAVTLLNEEEVYIGYASMQAAIDSGENLDAGRLSFNESQVGNATHKFASNSLRGNGNSYASDSASKAEISCGLVADIEVVNGVLNNVGRIINSVLRGCDFVNTNPYQDGQSLDRTYVADCELSAAGTINCVLVLLPGVQVDADFFATFTRNADGSYTTPQGGTVLDQRGVSQHELAQAALRAGVILNRPLVFGTFGGYNNGWSDGTELARSYSFEPAAPFAASAVQLLFGNMSLGASYSGGAVNPGQLLGLNAITVKAALYNGEGYYPLTFNGGQPSARILPGLTALTDRFPAFLKPGAGATLLRTSVSVDNAGEKWPLGITCRGTAAGDVAHNAGANYGGQVTSYHPIAVIGYPAAPRSYGSVALVGDSIFVGGGGADLPDLGWGARALNAANIPFVRMATYGALLDTYTRLDKPAVALPAISGVDHVLCNLGVNNMLDLLNLGLAATKTRYLALWAQLGANGARVHQSTITPYATTDNNLVNLKRQLNDWIRTVPRGLTSCVDASDKAETFRGSNLWKSGYSNDGLHPSETGAAALATAVNPTIFLL